MYLKERGWGGVGLIHVAQDRDQSVVGSCEHSNELSGSKRWRIL
jgi:hypothetical protein